MADACRVLPDIVVYIPLGYKMSWVLRRARAVKPSSNSEFSNAVSRQTGDSEFNSRRPNHGLD